MLGTILVIGQLALAHGSSPAPAIIPNDNRHSAGQFARGVLAVDLVARHGLWYPETKTGPGIPIAAFGMTHCAPRAEAARHAYSRDRSLTTG